MKSHVEVTPMFSISNCLFIQDLVVCLFTDWFPPGNGFQYKVFGQVNIKQAGSACQGEDARLASVGMRNETMRR